MGEREWGRQTRGREAPVRVSEGEERAEEKSERSLEGGGGPYLFANCAVIKTASLKIVF